MIRLKNVTKTYAANNAPFQALKKVSLQVSTGEFVAIMGPSGAGKTTLLHLIGGLDVPSEGSVWIREQEISRLNETKRTLFRRKHIGMIFQNHRLLPALTVRENIALPLYADKTPSSTIEKRVDQLLEQFDLKDQAQSFPDALSGGEQQRVAIARALSMNPPLLLADEPTGNLDRKRGSEILKQLASLHKEGITIVMVTHDPYAAGFAERLLTLRDGRIIDECTVAKGGDVRELMENLFSPMDPQ